MKTITIPKKFGFPTLDITVNGKEYNVKSGEEITVEDHVADVIEHAIALEPKPKRYLSKFAQLVGGSITEVTAKDLEGISIISNNAFSNCGALRQITIPNSITKIGLYAFDWCAELESVYLPETPPIFTKGNSFTNIKSNCTFYCKSQASLDAYKAAEIWSTLAETYTFKVEE